jgi:hypothetical protein
MTAGIFKFNARVFPGVDYDIKCSFADTSAAADADFSAYQYNELVVTIPGDSQIAQVSAGNFLLTTKDGTYCNATAPACWKDQTPKVGSVQVNLVNALTSEGISGAKVALTKYWWPQTNQYSTATSLEGAASFKNVRYQCYTATVNDSAYKPTSQRFCLQGAKNDITMNLLPIKTNSDYILQMLAPSKSIDFDFNLTVESGPDGLGNKKTCTVSPVNKYCAFARHLNDQTSNSGQSELIEIQQFAVAYYMSFLAPAPTYAGTCQASQLSEGTGEFKFGKRNLLLAATSTADCATIKANGGFSWECSKQEIKKSGDGSSPISQLALQTRTFGNSVNSDSQVEASDKKNIPTPIANFSGGFKGWKLGEGGKVDPQCLAKFLTAACYSRSVIQSKFGATLNNISDADWTNIQSSTKCDQDLKSVGSKYVEYFTNKSTGSLYERILSHSPTRVRTIETQRYTPLNTDETPAEKAARKKLAADTAMLKKDAENLRRMMAGKKPIKKNFRDLVKNAQREEWNTEVGSSWKEPAKNGDAIEHNSKGGNGMLLVTYQQAVNSPIVNEKFVVKYRKEFGDTIKNEKACFAANNGELTTLYKRYQEQQTENAQAQLAVKSDPCRVATDNTDRIGLAIIKNRLAACGLGNSLGEYKTLKGYLASEKSFVEWKLSQEVKLKGYNNCLGDEQRLNSEVVSKNSYCKDITCESAAKDANLFKRLMTGCSKKIRARETSAMNSNCTKSCNQLGPACYQMCQECGTKAINSAFKSWTLSLKKDTCGSIGATNKGNTTTTATMVKEEPIIPVPNTEISGSCPLANPLTDYTKFYSNDETRSKNDDLFVDDLLEGSWKTALTGVCGSQMCSDSELQKQTWKIYLATKKHQATQES